MSKYSIIALLLFLACASEPPSAPRAITDNAPRIKAAFLAPVNAFAPLDSELQPGADRVFEEIGRQFVARKITVHTKSLFMFRTATNSVMDSKYTESEPIAGSADAGFRALFAKLSEDVEFDALVIPEVVMRSVTLDGKSGKWDGVRRRQAGGSRMRWSGTSSAPSVRIQVYDKEGRLLSDEYGGLDLIFAANIQEERMELVEDPISDEKHIREGVKVALKPYFSSIGN